jgi:hypothetical protein
MRITLALALALFTASCLSEGGRRTYTVDDYMADPAVAAAELEPVDPATKHEVDFTVAEPQLTPEPPAVGASDEDEPTGEGLAELLKENSRAILNSATHVETVRYSSAGAEVAKGRSGDQSYARRILAVVFDEKRIADWGGPLCQTFAPNVGFRLSGAQGSAELLLSFNCSELQLRVKDPAGNVLQVLRADFPEDKGGRQELLGVSQEAFPKELLLH